MAAEKSARHRIFAANPHAHLFRRVRLGKRLQLNRRQIADRTGRTLVFCDHQFERAGVRVKRLAIHRVRDQDFSWVKAGIDLGERKDSLISVRASGYNIVGERFATKLTP